MVLCVMFSPKKYKLFYIQMLQIISNKGIDNRDIEYNCRENNLS
jgi:hypothetical protein